MNIQITRPFGLLVDINPHNILVSDPDGLNPVVKLGDLGCGKSTVETNVVSPVLTNIVTYEGFMEERPQGLEIRAPEVWRGLGCWQSSDVWSLGVTVSWCFWYIVTHVLRTKLVHWMVGRKIFGPTGKFLDGLMEAWCIAKIMRLVGHPDTLVREDYVDEFVDAAYIEQNTFTFPDTTIERQFITLGTVRQELEKLPGTKVEPGFIEFIEFLFVLDHERRPSAQEALQHAYLVPVPDITPSTPEAPPRRPDKADATLPDIP